MKKGIYNRIFALVILVLCSSYVQGGITFRPSIRMWDTWMIQVGDDYHLFYLSRGDIGRAVSKDLIHWKPLPTIRNMAMEGDWDERGMRMTGCTIKHGDRYYMSYGSGQPGINIGFITSKDLVNWERYDGNPVLLPKFPYRKNTHWRDLVSFYNPGKQNWDGYLFGIHDKTGNPSIAHLSSVDYLDWTYHEPVFISEPYTRYNKGFVFLEVPDCFQMGDRHYIVFSSVRSRKEFTSGRKDASGTWYLIGENKEGPYAVPESPLLLGYGHGRKDSYVGHTIMYQGNRLLYHQTWGDDGPVCLGTPKLVHQKSDGTLELHFWQDLAKLEGELLYEKACLLSEGGDGDLRIWKQIDTVSARDFLIRCRINMKNAESGGIIWHHSENKAKGISFYPGKDMVTIGELEYRDLLNANTIENRVLDDYQDTGLQEGEIDVRIMVREHMAEVYINDRWIFTTSMPGLIRDGGFGYWSEGGDIGLEGLRISVLEPLDTLQ